MNDGGNLFEGIDAAAPQEVFERIVAQPGVLIERIVSTGQASPEGFWYDDPRDEWVVLLTGAAELEFEAHRMRMKPATTCTFARIAGIASRGRIPRRRPCGSPYTSAGEPRVVRFSPPIEIVLCPTRRFASHWFPIRTISCAPSF